MALLIMLVLTDAVVPDTITETCTLFWSTRRSLSRRPAVSAAPVACRSSIVCVLVSTTTAGSPIIPILICKKSARACRKVRAGSNTASLRSEVSPSNIVDCESPLLLAIKSLVSLPNLERCHAFSSCSRRALSPETPDKAKINFAADNLTAVGAGVVGLAVGCGVGTPGGVGPGDGRGVGTAVGFVGLVVGAPEVGAGVGLGVGFRVG